MNSNRMNNCWTRTVEPELLNQKYTTILFFIAVWLGLTIPTPCDRPRYPIQSHQAEAHPDIDRSDSIYIVHWVLWLRVIINSHSDPLLTTTIHLLATPISQHHVELDSQNRNKNKGFSQVIHSHDIQFNMSFFQFPTIPGPWPAKSTVRLTEATGERKQPSERQLRKHGT